MTPRSARKRQEANLCVPGGRTTRCSAAHLAGQRSRINSLLSHDAPMVRRSGSLGQSTSM